MRKPNKKKKPQTAPAAVPQSDKQYLLSGMARRLPIAECWVSDNWQEQDLQPITVVVARQHKNGNYTVGTYLVDLKCMGLKQTSYRVNYPADEYRELMLDFDELQTLTIVDYRVAHNVVYGGIAYAQDLGIRPQDGDWAASRYVLDEDTDEVELLELECGFAGQPLFIAGPYDRPDQILAKLDKTVGKDNYGFIPYDPTGQVIEDLAAEVEHRNNPTEAGTNE